MTPSMTFDAKAFIEREVREMAGASDSRYAAESVLQGLTPEQALAVLEVCLSGWMRRRWHELNDPGHEGRRATEPSTTVDVVEPARAESRWGLVRHAQESGELTIWRWQVQLGEVTKPFCDCSTDEVVKLAGAHYQRAKGEMAEAQRLRDVATAMRACEVATVGDLPSERLREIFNA